MLNIDYNSERVAFNQTECGICLESYKERDRVVELACKHIFHPDCMPESVVRCPKCKFSIPGRGQNPSREEVEKVIDSIIRNALALMPCAQSATPQNIEDIRRSFVEMAFEQITQTVIRTYDPFTQLRDISETLRTINDANPGEIRSSIQRHSAYIVNAIEEYHRDHPVNLNESLVSPTEFYQTSMPNCMGFLQSLGISSQKLTNYVVATSESVCRNRRVGEIYEDRKTQFIQLHQDRLRSLGTLGRFKHLNKLDGTTRKLLSNLPEAQTSLSIRKGMIVGAVAVYAVATCFLIGKYGLFSGDFFD